MVIRKLLAVLCALFVVVCSFAKPKNANPKIVVAYVTSNPNAPIPNPHKMTHINYAFGVMNDTFDGVVIQNPDKLHEVAALKKQNPQLSVMLSIGGWGAGGFSEMAIDPVKRAKFVEHCKQIVKEFKIDGIDMDWEYPTSPGGGISHHPSDTENFTSLIKELRDALGKQGLVTFASVASAKYVDFKAIEPYVDFVNLMVYDVGRPHRGMHHSALLDNPRSRMSVEKSVKLHHEAGLPKHKIIVGVPFYGHGNTEKGYSDFINYPDIESTYGDQLLMWDDVAKVPYYVSRDDNKVMLCVFDNPRSLKLKCDYVLDNDLGGIMYWEYNCDDKNGTLRDVVWDGMNSGK